MPGRYPTSIYANEKKRVINQSAGVVFGILNPSLWPVDELINTYYIKEKSISDKIRYFFF